MDKLQWFKFCPTDWVMGKIQKCPEITQARFLKLCCLYWNKECIISVDDAIIEIDKDHFDILVSKKIIFISDDLIHISFLDEQNVEIKETSKDKSVSGIVGNLKRWHPKLYSRFTNKEISLDTAIELSKLVAHPSHTDSTPIATPSQNIADKDKDKDKEDIKNREDKNTLLNFKKNEIDFTFCENSELKPILLRWLDYKKWKGQRYKGQDSVETMFKKLCDYSNNDQTTALEIIEDAIAKNYSGFFKPTKQITQNGNTKIKPGANNFIGGIPISEVASFHGKSADELLGSAGDGQ